MLLTYKVRRTIDLDHGILRRLIAVGVYPRAEDYRAAIGMIFIPALSSGPTRLVDEKLSSRWPLDTPHCSQMRLADLRKSKPDWELSRAAWHAFHRSAMHGATRAAVSGIVVI